MMPAIVPCPGCKVNCVVAEEHRHYTAHELLCNKCGTRLERRKEDRRGAVPAVTVTAGELQLSEDDRSLLKSMGVST